MNRFYFSSTHPFVFQCDDDVIYTLDRIKIMFTHNKEMDMVTLHKHGQAEMVEAVFEKHKRMQCAMPHLFANEVPYCIEVTTDDLGALNRVIECSCLKLEHFERLQAAPAIDVECKKAS